ncbi:hypothetical protein EIP91_010132 [Steccherinum ochraceum]|uniref:Uncharacterized protein n=1 Tax=Steccherinum ochraceum TaxID=92696 RepID=A0A4R0RTY0_9APHY|nr:hypothetical protein EIP91_010132 [Steccherinum ochraceum]
MAFRTLTFQSISLDSTKLLKADATIVVTLHSEQRKPEDRETPVVAWKVLRFAGDAADVAPIRLYTARRIGATTVQTLGSCKIVAPLDNGAGLGPNQHLSISASGRWSNNFMFDMSADSSFVTNNSHRPTMFITGSRSPTSAFEPMTLLPELQPDEGVQVRYPYFMQVYDMTGTDCVEGQILETRGFGSLSDYALLKDSERQPQPLDIRVQPEDIVFQIYTGLEGVAVLERIVRPKRILRPRPPAVHIPSEAESSPLFGQALRSPILARLQPRSPNMALSPGFNLDWDNPTPPRTPLMSLPSPPAGWTSPGFLSPIRTPVAEAGASFFIPS